MREKKWGDKMLCSTNDTKVHEIMIFFFAYWCTHNSAFYIWICIHVRVKKICSFANLLRIKFGVFLSFFPFPKNTYTNYSSSRLCHQIYGHKTSTELHSHRVRNKFTALASSILRLFFVQQKKKTNEFEEKCSFSLLVFRNLSLNSFFFSSVDVFFFYLLALRDVCV